jgi:hypothetical protein
MMEHLKNPNQIQHTSRYRLAAAGTQTAALAFGGQYPGPTYSAATEEYNGTAWTSVNRYNTAVARLEAGAGTSKLQH